MSTSACLTESTASSHSRQSRVTIKETRHYGQSCRSSQEILGTGLHHAGYATGDATSFRSYCVDGPVPLGGCSKTEICFETVSPAPHGITELCSRASELAWGKSPRTAHNTCSPARVCQIVGNTFFQCFKIRPASFPVTQHVRQHANDS